VQQNAKNTIKIYKTRKETGKNVLFSPRIKKRCPRGSIVSMIAKRKPPTPNGAEGSQDAYA